MRREWLRGLIVFVAADGRLCVEGRADCPAFASARRPHAERVQHTARHCAPAAHPRRPATASGRHRCRRRGPRTPDRRTSGDRASAAGPRRMDCSGMPRLRVVSCARVHNVIATIPGRAPGKHLLINAHYDSTPTGPGRFGRRAWRRDHARGRRAPQGNRRLPVR